MSPRVYFVLCLLVPVIARRGGGSHGGGGSRGGGGTHNFGGGGGSHHFGGGGSHNFGGGSSGGAHYPPSPGMSGTGTGNGHNYNTNNNQHNSNQNHNYPPGPGFSGNNPGHGTNYVHKTEVHHYHYSPPQRISYGNTYHPVFVERPPVYVYEYRNSGSRFDSLLTGLALYNLGKMSERHSHDHYDYNREYKSNPGEVCKFRVEKSTGDYDETRIKCQLMSSFIWEAEREPNKVATHSVQTVNVTQTTINGTVVTTVQNTTVVDALEAKGPSIKVTPGMKCYMIRISRDTTSMRKEVECGLLQAYAQNSFVNSSNRNLPAIMTYVCIFAYFSLFQ